MFGQSLDNVRTMFGQCSAVFWQCFGNVCTMFVQIMLKAKWRKTIKNIAAPVAPACRDPLSPVLRSAVETFHTTAREAQHGPLGPRTDKSLNGQSHLGDPSAPHGSIFALLGHPRTTSKNHLFSTSPEMHKNDNKSTLCALGVHFERLFIDFLK